MMNQKLVWGLRPLLAILVWIYLYLVVYGLQLSIFAKYGQAGAGLVWLAAGGVGCEVRA